MPEEKNTEVPGGLNEQQSVHYDVPPPPENFTSHEPVTPPLHPELAIIEPPKKPSKRKKIIILIAILTVCLIAVGAGIYWFVLREDSTTQPVENTVSPTAEIQPVKQTESKPEPEIDPLLKKFIEPTTGEVWLDAPKKVADQGFFIDDPNYKPDLTYYEVGSRNGSIIYVSVEQALGESITVFEKNANGAVTAIVRPDSQATYNESNETFYLERFAKDVKIDKTTHYDSLSLPATLDLGNGYSANSPGADYYADFIFNNDQSQQGGNYETVKALGKSKLEKFEFKYPDTNLTSTGYSITYPTGVRAGLVYEPIDTDLEKYQWSKGSISAPGNAVAISRGCGNFVPAVTRADTVTDNDVQEVGKSATGKTVYELKSIDHPILTKAYEEFVQYNKDIPNAPYSNITKADFVNLHAVVFHKDKNGQWLVYASEDLRPAYGCAKPVVYLYPTTPQLVSVKVGADVKVSDPYYNPLYGWNAFAMPSGLLNVGGQTYDSLFWEGPGQGTYPILNEGLVVKTEDAIATIKQQLIQQGLKQNEIDDFIEYWEPNLPAKPYTRLTWLNTAQLDQLAPLSISPKPDTVIRVFLDFAGLDEPVSLPPQRLEAIERKGFTVIEWGGLSTKKLY